MKYEYQSIIRLKVIKNTIKNFFLLFFIFLILKFLIINSNNLFILDFSLNLKNNLLSQP